MNFSRRALHKVQRCEKRDWLVEGQITHTRTLLAIILPKN